MQKLAIGASGFVNRSKAMTAAARLVDVTIPLESMLMVEVSVVLRDNFRSGVNAGDFQGSGFIKGRQTQMS